MNSLWVQTTSVLRAKSLRWRFQHKSLIQTSRRPPIALFTPIPTPTPTSPTVATRLSAPFFPLFTVNTRSFSQIHEAPKDSKEEPKEESKEESKEETIRGDVDMRAKAEAILRFAFKLYIGIGAVVLLAWGGRLYYKYHQTLEEEVSNYRKFHPEKTKLRDKDDRLKDLLVYHYDPLKKEWKLDTPPLIQLNRTIFSLHNRKALENIGKCGQRIEYRVEGGKSPHEGVVMELEVKCNPKVEEEWFVLHHGTAVTWRGVVQSKYEGDTFYIEFLGLDFMQKEKFSIRYYHEHLHPSKVPQVQKEWEYLFKNMLEIKKAQRSRFPR